MKKVVLLLVSLLLSTASIAQHAWSVGVLGSYGHYKFNPAQRQFGQYRLQIYGQEPLDMWRLGVFGRLPVGGPQSPWYVQAELARSGRSAHAQFENLAPTTYPLDFRISSPGGDHRRYDLGTLLGLRLFRTPVRLLAGPVVSYVPRRELLRDHGWPTQYLGAPYRKIEEDFFNGFNRVVASYQVGAGLEVWRLSADLRYEGNLTPVVGQVRHEGQTYRGKITGNLWLVTLGVRLWEKEKKKDDVSPRQ
jgi:hypothetical protein